VFLFFSLFFLFELLYRIFIVVVLAVFVFRGLRDIGHIAL
jgi:hypothetical protein